MRMYLHILMVSVLLLALASGCRRKVEDSPVEASPPPVVASAMPETPPPPEPAPAKPGMAKARQFQAEFLEERVKSMQENLVESARIVNDAERMARQADPELGKLYRELVDGQIAYRKALEMNAQYAQAKASNTMALTEFSRLIERRDSLKEEISHE
ncbi:MAG: hypothetical protein HQ523_02945 [Lentisphaerae bacterium]|nr:hypothetical protein [Lentisphaerota bacterium]